MYVDSVRPSAQSFPPASRLQHDLPAPSADKDVESVPEMPLLPPHLVSTESPGHAEDNTLRAMGQSSRYSTAHLKPQDTKVVAREAIQRARDISTLKTYDRAKFQIAPQEQDMNAARILVEVAREQHPISPAQKVGALSVKKGGASEANASRQYTRKCPVTSCGYHLDRGFWSKTEKDHHIMTHFESDLGFYTTEHRYSLPWPNFIEDPENFFPKIEILKRRLRQYDLYGGAPEVSTCYICFRTFYRSGYVKHLDDCIVHAVQAQALGTAPTCPVSTCEHDPPTFPWGTRTNEPTVKRFVPSLGCSRCYTIQCQCPPTQQEKARSSHDGFLRPLNDLKELSEWLFPGR